MDLSRTVHSPTQSWKASLTMVGMVVPLTVLLILFWMKVYLELVRLENSADERERMVRRGRRRSILSPRVLWC